MVGLALAGMLALVWHWGNRRGKDPVSANRTTAGAAQNPPSLQTTPAIPDPLLKSMFAVVATNPPNALNTNRFAYRLGNTTEPLESLIRNERAVLLRNAFIDTALPARLEIPKHLKAESDPGSYVVQARGAITQPYRDELERTGASIVSYVPNNSFLVRANMQTARKITALPGTRAVLPFEPYYKLDLTLLPLAVRQEPCPYGELNIVAFPAQAKQVQAALEKMGAEITREAEHTILGDVLAAKVPAMALAVVAQIPEVHMIGVRAEKNVLNDLSRVKLRVSRTATNRPPNDPLTTQYGAPRPDNYLTGQGIVVGVNDTGVDTTHVDLTNRVFGPAANIDLDGHGTHVTGSLLGDGTGSPLGSSGTNAMGSSARAIFYGVAPKARAYVQDFAGPDTALQTNTALRDILISNNSWGYGTTDYDIFAASYDAAVRDSLPGRTGEQEVSYVFAAGNEGGGGPNGLNGIANSIASPATAKNVITVGASDQLRFISNVTVRCTITTNSGSSVTICETNAPWLGETDSDNQVSGYSSRGNVGPGLEGPFGRFKPDVIAPGSMVVSARSAQYNDPAGSTNFVVFRYNRLAVALNATDLYALNIPANGVRVELFAVSNSASPSPFPGLLLDAEFDAVPSGSALATNTLILDPSTAPALQPGATLYYTVANPFYGDTVVFDLVVRLWSTNDAGDYFTILQNLNEPLKPHYRYESGTSMAAPKISGMLALMQEYLTNNFNMRPSPALLKAMIINGARSLSQNYNLHTHAVINHQGWGIASMSNSIPIALSSGATLGPMRLYDQDITNGLATGGTHVYQVTVPPQARSYPLRMSLVWTDPPGNPVSSVKLVNDLNMVVTGAVSTVLGGQTNTSSLVWVGNNFPPGSDFTAPIIAASTDPDVQVSTNLIADMNAVRDAVNNVENVYIAPPLATNYTIIVKAHRVNVNALNSHSNSIAQDYALVISSGNVAATNVNLGVSAPTFTNDPSPRLAALVRETNSNSSTLLNQRVGANSALIISTNGATNQWSFFVYTNVPTANFTNVLIVTFLPPNLSRARFREADIDLYVRRESEGATPIAAAKFTNELDATQISLAQKSTLRGGTEFALYTNAQPNEVFYIGVKSEDQQAANFGILAASSDIPFNRRDGSNNIIARALALPAPIPDGTPDNPGGTSNLFAFVMLPNVTVRRAYVTNSIFHEQAGDLIGILSHQDLLGDGSMAAVTLNNHRTWNGLETSIYDDSNEGDLDPMGQPPDGPGTLRSFAGQNAFGPWNLTVSDNALFHTGYVDNLTVVIEPASTNAANTGLVIDQRFCILPGRWRFVPVNVGFDIFNMETCISDFESSVTSPIAVYIRQGGFPDFANFDHHFDAVPPGTCFDVGLGDEPPLTFGRYQIGLYNSNAAPVCVRLRVTLSQKGDPGLHSKYYSANTSVALIDDAVTNSTIFVPQHGKVADVRVGIRVQHDRASDLAFHLVSPSGTRILLAENRGRTNRSGYGTDIRTVTTNVVRQIFFDGFENAATAVGYQPPAQVSGWNVVAGRVDVFTTAIVGPFPAHSGVNYLDLNSDGESGVIARTVPLTPGKTYRLSFQFGNHPAVPASARVTLANTFTLDISTDRTTWRGTSIVFTATSGNLLQFQSTVPGSAGVLLDTVRIHELEIRTNLYIYAGFTENTILAKVPIKFAPPPFGSTNINNYAPTIGGFEAASPGEYAAPSTIDGWSVRTNQVSVIDDWTLAYSGSRLLALADARVSWNFPTLPGRDYTVSFAYRDSGVVSWWPADGSLNDIVSLNTGTPYDMGFGASVRDFGFESQPTGWARIDLQDPERLKLTNSLTIEGWVFARTFQPPNNLNRNHILFRGANDSARDAYKFSVWSDSLLRFSIDNDISEALLLYPNPVPAGEWLHVAASLEDVRGTMRLFVNGLPVAQTTTAVRPYAGRPPFSLQPAVAIGNHPLRGFNNSFYGFIDELAVFDRALSASEIRAIHQARSMGKYDPLAPNYLPQKAKARLQIDGLTDTLIANPNWERASYTFTATSNSATVRLSGYALGVLLDGFEARLEDSDTEWYLPEESLKPFIGENSFGTWNLEVWDSRLGGAITNLNPQLLSWRLDIAYPETNPPSALLTSGSKYTNTVSGAEARYFIVDLSCSSGVVTNTLRVLSSTTAGLDLTFNNFTLPTNGAGDLLLMTGVTGISNALLQINEVPLVSPFRYYLAVRNVDSNEINSFVLSTDVDCSASLLVALRNNEAHASAIAPGNLQGYGYTTADDVVQLTFEAMNAGDNVDLLVQPDYPIDFPGNALYASRHSATANEWITLTTNSAPRPLNGAASWYAAVENVSTGKPPYLVKVTEVRQSRIHVLSAKNTFVQSNLPPGEIDYYVVNVDKDAHSAVFNIAVNSNEADLYLKRGTFPTTTLYDFRSAWTGSDYQIVSAPSLPAGEWRVAVANPSRTASGSYVLSVLSVTNAAVPDGVLAQTSSSSFSSEAFTLSWMAPAEQEFRVEYTDVLPAEWKPLSGTISVTNGQFTFVNLGPQAGNQRFFRVVRVR
jgi:subtilisin-like proprotein convertase family protein